jgi:hypothetical protein
MKKTLTVKEAIAALSKCHPDAEVHFSVDWDREEGLVAVEHEVMWMRERGDQLYPGTVYLHNNSDHICELDGSISTDHFLLT